MIYLASNSPRRRELLAQLGIEFELLLVDVDESVLAGEAAKDYVARVAQLKAVTAQQKMLSEGLKQRAVLAADTSVIVDEHILGKPQDEADSRRMLKLLSGRTHQVRTAISVAFGDQVITETVVTEVSFRDITDQEMADYWQSGEPQDKAGSYGIQGLGGKFVANINGSYFAVVGLPLMETERLLNSVIQ